MLLTDVRFVRRVSSLQTVTFKDVFTLNVMDDSLSENKCTYMYNEKIQTYNRVMEIMAFLTSMFYSICFHFYSGMRFPVNLKLDKYQTVFNDVIS